MPSSACLSREEVTWNESDTRSAIWKSTPCESRIEIIDPPEGLEFAMVGGGEVVRPFTPSPEARARADEIVRAYDEWRPKHNTHPQRDGQIRGAVRAAVQAP
jgi:hypothetical protein